MRTASVLTALVLAAVLPVSAAVASSAGPLTLAACLDAVLSRYPTLDAAQAAVDAARGRTVQSAAPRLPQVSLEGEYRYMSLRPNAQFPGPGGVTNFYTTIHNSYDAGLHVRQLLTDFGRTDALVDLARMGEISARDALDQARHQLGYETIQAFYGAVLLRASERVADEEIRALDEALRISQKKFSGGTATKFDVLTTQVRLANAENRRTDTRASLEKEEALLRQLLGWAPGVPVDLVGDFNVPPEMPDPSSAIADGLKNRPEMRIAKDSQEAADLKLQAANRENRPVLSAQATGGVQDSLLPNLYANRGYVDAGLSVSVPLFTGRRIAGERIEARANLRSAGDRVGELSRTITTEVEDAFADLKAAQSHLLNADALVAQADEAQSLARSRYSNGVITNFELLDSQSSARAAELARLQARYDCVLALHAVARAAGRPPRAD